MSKHVVTDSSDPEQVRLAKQQQEDEDKDLMWVMSQPRGRRFIYQMIHETCHVDAISHVPGDTHGTAFNEGARAVGLALEAHIRNISPKQYVLMQEENHYG